MTPDAKVAGWACRQNGIVTHQQALEAGLTNRAIQVRVSTGRWIRLRRGVYVVAGTPQDERQVVLAACLAAGPEALVAHLSAGRLWGLALPRPAAIELVGPRRRLEGVVSHSSITLVASDRARLGAVPITSPARTLVDASGSVTPDRLGEVVDDALRRGLVRLEELRRCHERVDTGPGRRPTLAMREVLVRRQPGYSAGDSLREADIVQLLAASGLPAPVLGHRIRVGRRTYKLDIAWPEAMLCIEFDGWDTHRTYTAFHRDRQRGRRIVASGWTLLPVTAQTDLHELIGDVTRILDLSWRASTA
ncbi:MAG: hypothetical protein JWN67_1399 [Actinomycetia bacterium]|nr:hypothetical protein [Actinomycetes bacterium]